MNKEPIRAFQALTVEELELLAVIGSLHATAGMGAFYFDKFVRRRLATASRLEASAAPADAEEQRLRLVTQVSMQEVGYLASCYRGGEDPSVTHERIRKTPLTFAFAVAELATGELERAWAEAYASGRPVSEVIGPLVRIHDDTFSLARRELAHVLTNAWGEGRPFGEVVKKFSPARGVKGRLIGAVGRREPTPLPAGMGSH
jgi:hypothetical protein